MEVIRKRSDYTYQEDIPLGGCYRTQNGTSIYMKIKASKVNAVAIETGHTFAHNPDYIVHPVKGAFHEQS